LQGIPDIHWPCIGVCFLSDPNSHSLSAPGQYFDVVDIFNVRSGVWTTAALSAARFSLAATSLPNDGVAIFAGGELCDYYLSMRAFCL
jgi:hypothetical protein